MPSSKAIVGIVGEIASGKGVAAKHLQEKYGAVVFKFSTPMRDCLKRLHVEPSRENMQLFSRITREAFGQGLYSKIIALDAAESEAPLIITDGIRRLSDVADLAQIPGFRLVEITADERTRYERVKSRNENPGDADKTWASFVKDSQAETEVSIREIAARAEFHLANDGTLDDLYAQIDAMMEKING